MTDPGALQLMWRAEMMPSLLLVHDKVFFVVLEYFSLCVTGQTVGVIIGLWSLQTWLQPPSLTVCCFSDAFHCWLGFLTKTSGGMMKKNIRFTISLNGLNYHQCRYFWKTSSDFGKFTFSGNEWGEKGVNYAARISFDSFFLLWNCCKSKQPIAV